MLAPLKISHYSHSGRLRPHEHTSYIPLAFLVFVVGVMLAGLSYSTVSASDPPPQAGSIGLSGTVPAAPPKVAATIDDPKSGQHFATSPITVSGTCPAGTLVEIFKNDIFAGSAPCESGDTYSLQVDLLYGQNSLTAQVYDVLNQAGPVSAAVVVFYDAAPPPAASLNNLNFSGSQLLLETDAVYRGSFPDQMLNVPVTIIGGVAPFAINAEWGDSTNKVIPRSDNTLFNASHMYQKPGTYEITLQGSDSDQQVAFLTVAAIVNGQPAVISANTTAGPKASNKLLVLWPLYAIAATLVVSFWMGERREKRILGGSAGPPPSLGPSTQPTA